MPRASLTPPRARKGAPRLALVAGRSTNAAGKAASRAKTTKSTPAARTRAKATARKAGAAPRPVRTGAKAKPAIAAKTAKTAKAATAAKTQAAAKAAAAKAAAAKAAAAKAKKRPPLALVPRPAEAPKAAEPVVRVPRERLLERYTPLIRYVVERLSVGLPKNVDHDDLMSAGVLGLLDAYDKFDSGKGTKFETYAVWRIKGAVLDQLRALDWASRSVRRKAREVEASTRRLDQRLGRAATDEEVAKEAKMSLADYHRLMDQVRGAVLLSLDETRSPEEGDSLGLAEVIEDPNAPDVLARLEEEETRIVLLDTLNRLPEQERIVVALYYYEHMTLREIGVTLGISESRVSQVHSRAVLRLRSRVRRALAA
jgi:RNA polymerase sigma factor for flagellar operon FliA